MQLLAEWGNEGGRHRGLGLIPGEVCRLEPATEQERIPHVGWNEVYPTQPTPLLQGIAPGIDFYFVHSYHFVTASENSAVARTPYCGNFVSIVQRENVFGTQFHPEKSGRFGFRVLENFLQYWKADG
jgi:glutamine amidotransferase